MDPTPRKMKRNKIYIICGVVMLAALSAITIYFSFLQKSYLQTSFVFWAETVALVAFGISWLTKGGALLPDQEEG